MTAALTMKWDAVAANERLSTLIVNDRITPDQVVDDAEAIDSPLHWYPEFIWDQAVAARAYNISKARNLIRLYVPPSTPVDVAAKTIYFVHDARSPQEQGYSATPRIAVEDEAWARVQVAHELRGVRSALVRAIRVAASVKVDVPLDPILQAVDAVVTELTDDAEDP